MPTEMRSVEDVTKLLVMLVGVVLPGDCKEIQAKLMMSQPDLTKLEAGFDQHAPQIWFVVMHLVIVYLYFRTESEPKCE